MEFVARAASRGGLSYWLRSLVPGLIFEGQTESTERDSPAVIIRGASGEERVFQRTGTYGQAVRAVARLRRELRTLGPTGFCLHYGLPDRLAD